MMIRLRVLLFQWVSVARTMDERPMTFKSQANLNAKSVSSDMEPSLET